MNDEDEAFFRAILDRPTDATTWRVYADWLEEHGKQRHAKVIRHRYPWLWLGRYLAWILRSG